VIIKSKSIKSKTNLSNVLRYILVGHDLTDSGFVLSRAIRGDRKYHKELEVTKGDTALETAVLEARIDNMLSQFESNNDKRLIPHKNGNRAYHEIISFHANDSKNLSREAMLDVARTYARGRSPNSLVVASMHRNREHLHIHVIVSAIELGGKVKRLSRGEFRQLKQKMERYQEKHLQLEHSKVNHSKKKEPSLLKDAVYQLQLRTGKLSEKQQLQLDLAEIYSKASSSKNFIQLLKEKGHEIYKRGSQLGIKKSRKYRLKTLGYPIEKLQLLDQNIERNKRLSQVRNLRNRRSKGRGFDRER
jgi:hypothetical protein